MKPASRHPSVATKRETRFLDGWNICCALSSSECDIASSHVHGDFNLLRPNVNYSGRTAPLTSKVAFYIFTQQV